MGGKRSRPARKCLAVTSPLASPAETVSALVIVSAVRGDCYGALPDSQAKAQDPCGVIDPWFCDTSVFCRNGSLGAVCSALDRRSVSWPPGSGSDATCGGGSLDQHMSVRATKSDFRLPIAIQGRLLRLHGWYVDLVQFAAILMECRVGESRFDPRPHL